MTIKALKRSTKTGIAFEETLVVTTADTGIQLMGNMPVTAIDNRSPAGVATASSTYSGFSPSYATDGTYTSSTLVWASDGVSSISWLQLDFDVPQQISRWKVTHAGVGDVSWIPRNTKDFALQRYDVGTAAWVSVDTVTGNTSNVTDRAVTPFIASKIRIYITVANSVPDNYSRIFEWENYGIPLYPIAPQTGDLTGTPTTTSLAAIGAGATLNYPSQIIYDTKGRVTGGTSGISPSATAVGGDVSGTVASIVLPSKGTPGTYAYPSQIITDAKGAVTGATGGSQPVTTASAPLAVSAGNASIAITPANPGGAVAVQAATPGLTQTGHAHLSGSILAGTDVTAVGTVQGATVTSTGAVNAVTKVVLNNVPMLEEGSSFPTSGLVDGQRYRNKTYRSWFSYNLADLKWRQEAPGEFNGSFPTVSSGDNTVAPQIEVKRADLKKEIYFYDGARWLSTTRYPLLLGANTNGTILSPLSATTQAFLNTGAPDETQALYIEKLVSRNVTNTTLDATNNWTIELWRQPLAPGANVQLGTTNTFQTGRVAGTPYLNVITVNTALSAVTDAYLFFLTATKNAAPGTLAFTNSIMWYRLIGI